MEIISVCSGGGEALIMPVVTEDNLELCTFPDASVLEMFVGEQPPGQAGVSDTPPNLPRV